MTKNSTLQVESQLTEVSMGVVQNAIKAAIALLVVHRGKDPLEACTQVLDRALEMYGWGAQPFHKGRNFTPEGWVAYAEACAVGKVSNTTWPDYDRMKPVVRKLVA